MKKITIPIISIIVVLIIGITLFLFVKKDNLTYNKNKIDTTSTEKVYSNDFSALFPNGYKGSSKLLIKSSSNEEVFSTNASFNGNSDLIHEMLVSNKANKPSEIIYSFKDNYVYVNNGGKYSKYPKQVLGSISVINLNELNNAFSSLKDEFKIEYINEKYEVTLKNGTFNNNFFKTFLPYSDIGDLKLIKDLSFKLTFNNDNLLENESFSFSFMLDNLEYKLNYDMSIEPSNEKITLPTDQLPL